MPPPQKKMAELFVSGKVYRLFFFWLIKVSIVFKDWHTDPIFVILKILKI